LVQKEVDSNIHTESSSIKHVISKKNPTKVLEAVIEKLQAEYHFSQQDILELIKAEDELSIPLSVFSNNKGTALQILIKYLKEEKHLNFSAIGKLIKRDERSIWGTYQKTKSTLPNELKLGPSKISIPISIFEMGTLSAFEGLVFYLKEHHHLQFSKIGELIHKDRRTIWTVYNRATKKKGGGKDE
jgi:hypothetical protein